MKTIMSREITKKIIEKQLKFISFPPLLMGYKLNKNSLA